MIQRPEAGERAVTASVDVNAPRSAVWEAWTTEAGIQTFFAPECRVELRPNGPYEMLFEPSQPAGSQGGEGNIVLAVQPERLLSVTWNAPPKFPTVREQRTVVVVRFEAVDDDRTQVTLTHLGWGDGGEWDAAFEYFNSAWNDIVLPRLQHRFDEGPVDWSNRDR